MFTVYRITNLINGRFYIGVHKTNNPVDSYLGSGKVLGKAIQKYGVSNFKKDVLFTYVREYYALRKEKELISEAKKDPLCYNIADGGKGGWGYLHANPTPALIEARKRNGTITMLKINSSKLALTSRLRSINERNANPTQAMIEARRRNGVVMGKCGAGNVELSRIKKEEPERYQDILNARSISWFKITG